MHTVQPASEPRSIAPMRRPPSEPPAHPFFQSSPHPCPQPCSAPNPLPQTHCQISPSAPRCMHSPCTAVSHTWDMHVLAHMHPCGPSVIPAWPRPSPRTPRASAFCVCVHACVHVPVCLYLCVCVSSFLVTPSDWSTSLPMSYSQR